MTFYPNTLGWSLSYALAGFFAVVREAEWMNLRESWQAARDVAAGEAEAWRKRAIIAEAVGV